MVRTNAVDVSAFQSSSMAIYHQAGASSVIVKLTEGTTYFNPKAVAQIKSAHAHKMFVHAYHFATFSSSVSKAKAEAQYFIRHARFCGISKDRYLCLDWEVGDGNYCYGSASANTNAILAFLHECRKAGWHVLLYSGAYLMQNKIQTWRLTKRYGTCLWVASYATMGRWDAPNYNYFPSMKGIAIWQYTVNWHGLNVDGNVCFVDMHKQSKHKAVAKPKASPKPKPVTVVYAPVIKNDPNWKINLRTAEGHATKSYIKTNSYWKVVKTKKIKGITYYCLGTDTQWVSSKFLKVAKTK